MNKIDASPSSIEFSPKTKVGSAFTGLVVFVVGLFFLADNFGIRLPFLAWHNWWALFILVGAATPLSRAWRCYRSIGAIDAAVAHSLISALAVVAVATILLLGLSFERWWPVFVVIGGLWMIASAFVHKRVDECRQSDERS